MTEVEVDVDAYFDEPAIMLAKKSSKTKEHYAYGFAAASVGFAAMGAYIYLTKSKKKVNNEKNQQLIDSDFEFQTVWSFRYDKILCFRFLVFSNTF